jgi:hypothetical protein
MARETFVAGHRNVSAINGWHIHVEQPTRPLAKVGDPMNRNSEAASRRAGIVAAIAVTCAICALYLPLLLG